MINFKIMSGVSKITLADKVVEEINATGSNNFVAINHEQSNVFKSMFFGIITLGMSNYATVTVTTSDLHKESPKSDYVRISHIG
jgi:ABC-type dipeptide/oligopeptide/nickel transport system permease component